jgi:2-polyprenyl-3-methyl-5-hydroxy-6-metoxy-1,4-benzoquinol methylase
MDEIMIPTPKTPSSTQQFFSKKLDQSLEQFWDNQALLPGYQGVVVDNEQHISTQMLYNFLSTQINIKDETILDIGCGVGRLFPIFINFGAKEVHGIDISMNMLRVARFKYPQQQIFLHKLDISNQQMFDNFTYPCSLVLCITTLCHIIDDDSISQIIHSIVDKTAYNGIIFLCEPMSITVTTHYQHSNMKVRPQSFYHEIFRAASVDLIYNYRECFGSLEHVDSFRQVMVYKKKAQNVNRKQRKSR